MLKHPHDLATRPTVRWDSKTMKTVYVIETDLALSRDDPAYDDDKFNNLMEAAKDYLGRHQDYDSVDVIQVRRS